MTRQRRSRAGGQGNAKQYPRTARLGELLREIVAEELERIDDQRLELVTVTETRVDPDLKRALVWVSWLDDDPVREEQVLEALAQHRPRLQAAFARQARARNTPELLFRADEVARSAARIEEVLREHPSSPDGIPVPDEEELDADELDEDDVPGDAGDEGDDADDEGGR